MCFHQGARLSCPLDHDCPRCCNCAATTKTADRLRTAPLAEGNHDTTLQPENTHTQSIILPHPASPSLLHETLSNNPKTRRPPKESAGHHRVCMPQLCMSCAPPTPPRVVSKG
jgi:hypothetical protein